MLRRSLIGVAVLGATLAAQTGAFGNPVGLGAVGVVTNPDLALPLAGTAYNVAGVPVGWVLVPGASMTAPMVPLSATVGFGGTATSKVYFRNGTDALGGLGFTYEFSVTSAKPSADTLTQVSFEADHWNGVTLSDAGSVANPGGSTAPGGALQSWGDGDPYQIERDFGSGAPRIVFQHGGNGTALALGDTSALVWWETDAQFYATSSASLIDGGVAGTVAVYAVPEPATLLLGMIGLGGVGWIRKRVK